MISRRWLYLAMAASLILGASNGMAAKRGIHVGPPETPDPKTCWALIVGIDDYHHWPKLTTAVNDAKEVRAVLIERYGFLEDQVISLINDQATRKKILSTLRGLGKRVRKDHDSLFIYYAGHGQLDDLLETGYWVPVEAQRRAVVDFIDNAVILNYIRGIETLHTLLVADSCFAGSLFIRGPTPAPSEADAAYFERVHRLKSRQGFTSGNVEPVADSGLEGHSIFAYYFIKALKENRDPYLVPSTLFERIKIPLARNSLQTPIFKPLKDAKDEGGEFVFVLKEPVAEVSSEGGTSLALSPEGKPDLDARMRALEEERRRLQAEMSLLEEEKKLFHERKTIDEERKKLEELRKSLEAQLASFQKQKEAQSAVSKATMKEARPPKAPPSESPAASKQPPKPIAPSKGPIETAEPPQHVAPAQLTRVRPPAPLQPTVSPESQLREDGTILDPKTGIVWLRLQKSFTYDRAIWKAADVREEWFGGIHDWHIPSRAEAQRLLASREKEPGGPLGRIRGTFWIDEEKSETIGFGATQRYCTYVDLDRGDFFEFNETLSPQQAHELILVGSGP